MIHGFDLNCIALFENFIISGGDEKVIRLLEASKVTSDILARDAHVHIQGNKRGAGQALGLMTKSADEDFDVGNLYVTEDMLNSFTLWPEVAKMYGHGYEVTVLAVAHSSPILASASKAQNKEHSMILL